MSNRKLTILLLLTLFAISTFSQDLGGAHQCSHDSEDQPEAELVDIDEEFDTEGNNNHDGRTLASYNGLRTFTHYGHVSSTALRSYFEKSLIPPVVDYFRGALKNKYPVSGLLKFTSSSTCGYSTPATLRNGVAADIAWVLVLDSSSSYVANSYTCNRASGTGRPIAGRTIISTRYIQSTTDPLLHEKNMVLMMHEYAHILGFSKSMFNHFLNASGKKLSGHIKSAKLNGATTTVLDVAPLTQRVRNHFGCSSALGAYMENSGGSGTMGSHFDRRHYGIEAMTSGLTHQQPFSEFSLAVLEGSGWYVADYAYGDNFHWGKSKGCSFLTGSTCTPSTADTWCSSSSRSCTQNGRGGGSCGSDDRSDGCKYIKPSVSYDCENPSARNSARLPALQQYGRETGSKCFTGTLSTSNGASQTTYCFQPTCTGSGKNWKLTLNVGGKSVACAKKGQVAVSGYRGHINCPDPVEFCTSVGLKVCPRGCMNRGKCVNGKCQCNKGFKGSDCALNA